MGERKPGQDKERRGYGYWKELVKHGGAEERTSAVLMGGAGVSSMPMLPVTDSGVDQLTCRWLPPSWRALACDLPARWHGSLNQCIPPGEFGAPDLGPDGQRQRCNDPGGMPAQRGACTRTLWHCARVEGLAQTR